MQEYSCRYIHMDAFKLIGLSKTFKVGEGYAECPKLWDFFNANHAREKLVVENGIGTFALCRNLFEDGGVTHGKVSDFEYMIAGIYNGGEVPSGFKVVEIPASDWAVFGCNGPLPQSLQALNTYVWNDWLPAHAGEHLHVGSFNIECYMQNDFVHDGCQWGIWLPLERKVPLADDSDSCQLAIQKRLFALKDAEYATFQAKLMPSVAREAIIGVRTPQLRALAKELWKNEPALCEAFLSALPHRYFDENQLHAFLLENMRDFDLCIRYVEAFLPYVDNWATCDQLSPKVFKKHKTDVLEYIRSWISSSQTYTCRFGMEMLMTHFLDDAFFPESLDMVAAVKSDEYYVNMMVAWFFATALAKQWDSAIVYIERRSLGPWCHAKAIQKACESYRISAERKEYLRGLR